MRRTKRFAPNLRLELASTETRHVNIASIIDLLHVAIVAHHLICFAREATAGRQNASFYSAIARRRFAA